MAQVYHRLSPVLSWPVNVKFMVKKAALGQVSSELLGFSLSVSFHQCSVIIFIYMLLLQKKNKKRKRKRNKGPKPGNLPKSGKSGNIG
jgi:hypothetical protein